MKHTKKTACVKNLKSSKPWTSVLKNHLLLRTDNYLEQILAYLPNLKDINVY